MYAYNNRPHERKPERTRRPLFRRTHRPRRRVRTLRIPRRLAGKRRPDARMGTRMEATARAVGRRPPFARPAQRKNRTAREPNPRPPALAAVLGGSSRAHPDLGLHHPAPHTHRRPRANVLRTGSPGNQQPHIAARRQPGVAQRRIDLELPVGFQPLVARHRPFGRSLLRGGPQRRPPLPGAGPGLHVHRAGHPVQHLGLRRRPRRIGRADGRLAAIRIVPQHGNDGSGRPDHLRLPDDGGVAQAGRHRPVPQLDRRHHPLRRDLPPGPAPAARPRIRREDRTLHRRVRRQDLPHINHRGAGHRINHGRVVRHPADQRQARHLRLPRRQPPPKTEP